MLFSLSTISCQESGSSAETLNVFEVNAKLGKGINIPSIQNMNNDHYKLIKDAGFDNVRIPIKPFNETIGDEDFTLKESFLESLDLAVQRSLDNDIMPIIDLHEHHAMQADPIGNLPMFLAIWEQLADHYKDYPAEVLFEIANEPNMQPSIWNQIHSNAYNIIRKTNPNRTLLIGTVYGNQIEFLKDLALPEEDRNIIVTIHYYEPIQFTHQCVSWSSYSDICGRSWPAAGEEEDVISDFNVAQEWGTENNRPLHLGEFGATYAVGAESRIRYTRFVTKQANERGWSWSYWELNQDFGIMSLGSGQWNQQYLDALIEE